jgi:diguanylate cyclase (GGDEF)-like protein
VEKFGLDVQAEGLLDKLCHSDLVFRDDRVRMLRDIYGIIDGSIPKNEEYRIKNVDGLYYWYRVHCTIIRDKLGEPLRLIGFITDIDKQKKETLSLKEKAEHDLLTGLYNRITTTTLIDKAISQSDSNSCHALCAIDIDNFKHVNDILGHLVGDEVIVDIASEIKKQFRENDIMGRIGGDEFVVFLKDISPSDVQKKARILQNFFRRIHPDQDQNYKITGSIGIAIYPQDGKNYRELFVKADAAMYAAKNSGKDSFCIYSKELESVVHDPAKYDHRI